MSALRIALMILALLSAVQAALPALRWEAGAGYRSAAVSPASPGKTGFSLLPPSQTGITFSNTLADATVVKNQIYMIGSGLALGDVDGDGLCDIYLCRLEGPNALYRNLGDWKFEDVAGSVGVACPDQFSTGCVLADLDGDGDLDLLVNSIGGGTRYFVNDSKGHFQEKTDAGFLRKFAATTIAIADIDGDGDLDVYVANYRTTTIRSTGLDVLVVNGRKVIRPEDRESYEFTKQGLLLEHAEPDFLYINDGAGHFTDQPWTGGNFVDEDGKALSAAPKDWSLSAMFHDMNGDGSPDLYVCNDFWSPDCIWLNDRQGHFRALPRIAMRNTSTFAMGVDFADINGDGFDDFLVLDMLSRDHARRMRQTAMRGQNANQTGAIEDRPQVERNTLFLNRGDGTYAEIAQLSGLHASEWSWGALFMDVDLDGFPDVLITTGHGFDTQDTDTDHKIAAMGRIPNEKLGRNILQYPRLNVPNLSFRNQGDLTFEETSAAWGFDRVGVSHGIAAADLDNDGDLDVVVNNLNGPASIYRNESAAPRIAVRLKGNGKNTQGIGSRVKVIGGPVPQAQEIISGGRYLSSDDPVRMFATKGATNLSLEITWRNGKRSSIPAAQPNRIYQIEESENSDAAPEIASPSPRPFFRDLSDLLSHQHHESAFDDFAQQRSLTRGLSRLGPGVSWCDLDGDGKDDLLIGTGRSGEVAAFRNTGNGDFAHWEELHFSKVIDDQNAILALAQNQLLIVQSSYEHSTTNGSQITLWKYANGKLQPDQDMWLNGASAGPMALADIDGDGDLDLFIGARFVPGKYPEAAESRLWRNDNGHFTLVENWALKGLVSGAVWSDLNNDGFPDLIAACDWGPIRVFENRKGVLTEITDQLGLNKYRGFWNGVTVGDFDGDGRLDIVASNWGRNTPYHETTEWRAFYGDLSGDGNTQAVEGYVAAGRVIPSRDLGWLSTFFPAVLERYPTSKAYSVATLDDILGLKKSHLSELRANWFDSTLFLNRGDHFEPRSLPIEAQFGPAFGICVGDFDNDGNDDIFLAQNFFNVDAQTSRHDAGRGLWLKGNGKGNFTSVSAQQSGIAIYGECRGAALCDYDQDGKVDLVVGQNSAQTKLYRNISLKPGLRVRLQGLSTNPAAIGAKIRLVQWQGRGPVREIHAGSGYLSQDSAIQVLGYQTYPQKIEVQWPRGTTRTYDLPESAREVFLKWE